jgi:hypothetical protein
MGQKVVRFGQLGAATSRQDESIEVGEVGSTRPSLGGTGGHVVWWIGLIFRLLGGKEAAYSDVDWPLRIPHRRLPDGASTRVDVSQHLASRCGASPFPYSH